MSEIKREEEEMGMMLRDVRDWVEDIQYRSGFYLTLIVLWILLWAGLIYVEPRILMTGPELGAAMRAEQAR